MWLGFNELRKRSRFAQLIEPGNVVYDIGAHVGSYTLLAARTVGPSGQVFAFEPMPENLSFLRNHLQLNATANVVVYPVALWSDETTVAFRRRADRVSGGISEEGDVLVKTTTVDHFVGTGERPPDCMKIDVEGAESAVLQGAERTLRDHRPIVFVATHSPEQDRLCREDLEDAGYAVSSIDGHQDELIGVPK
jgi:FkbM family methyltransferase